MRVRTIRGIHRVAVLALLIGMLLPSLTPNGLAQDATPDPVVTQEPTTPDEPTVAPEPTVEPTQEPTVTPDETEIPDATEEPSPVDATPPDATETPDTASRDMGIMAVDGTIIMSPSTLTPYPGQWVTMTVTVQGNGNAGQSFAFVGQFGPADRYAVLAHTSANVASSTNVTFSDGSPVTQPLFQEFRSYFEVQETGSFAIEFSFPVQVMPDAPAETSLSANAGMFEINTTEDAVIDQNTLIVRAFNDPDGDGVDSIDDNCPEISNPDQDDWDDNGIGDSCDVPRDHWRHRDVRFQPCSHGRRPGFVCGDV